MSKELSIEFTRTPYIIKIKYDGKEIKRMFFGNAIDFISTLHILETKNDREIYDWCRGICIFTDLD